MLFTDGWGVDKEQIVCANLEPEKNPGSILNRYKNLWAVLRRMGTSSNP